MVVGVLQPILGEIETENYNFDSRDVFFNGGVDIVNETITFKSQHSLQDGELVYYSANNNAPIGIGTAYDLKIILMILYQMVLHTL